VQVDPDGMIEKFQTGYNQFSALWRQIFCDECFAQISRCAEMDSTNFHFPTETWVQILYELAATYHAWKTNRMQLIDMVTPLYFARVASFVLQSWKMNSEEAEELVEEQAMKFEQQKNYLLRVWDGNPGETSSAAG
jgi:hypothetical protein